MGSRRAARISGGGRRLTAWGAVAPFLLFAVLAATSPGLASAATGGAAPSANLPIQPAVATPAYRALCPAAAAPGSVTCFALVRTDVGADGPRGGRARLCARRLFTDRPPLGLRPDRRCREQRHRDHGRGHRLLRPHHGRVGSRRVPEPVRPEPVHDGQRLLQEARRARRHELPRAEFRLGRRDRPRHRDGLGDLPEVPHPARRGVDDVRRATWGRPSTRP